MPYGKPIKLFLFKTRHHKEPHISAKGQHLKRAPPQHGEQPCTDYPASCGAQLVTNSSASSPLPGSAGGSRGEAGPDLQGWGSLAAPCHAFGLLAWRGAPEKLQEGDFLQMFPLGSRKLDTVVSNKGRVLWEVESSSYQVRWSGSKV